MADRRSRDADAFEFRQFIIKIYKYREPCRLHTFNTHARMLRECTLFRGPTRLVLFVLRPPSLTVTRTRRV